MQPPTSQMSSPSRPTRRAVLGGALAGTAGAALAAPAASGLVVARPEITSGLQLGDVTHDAGIVWSRSSVPGRMLVTLTDERGRTRRLRGPWTDPRRDCTAKLALHGLRPGTHHEVAVSFEDADGREGQRATGTFTTADTASGATSFVWTGDTAGQGWGINPELGGMRTYAAMAATKPDFFLHSGDTIYADGPIEDTVVEPDGQVWRNLVIDEVTEVAQDLRQYRGRHRYNLMDHNVRELYAHVPVIAQWDDHETTNNWYPGEVLDDPKYDRERRVDVLAGFARRAFFEYQPLADGHGRRPWTPEGGGRIHRTIHRGRHLDVFSLDMRTWKGDNTANTEARATPILGQQQVAWLIRELRRSTATWKVIANDLPLGLVVPDGDTAQEGVGNADAGRPLGREQEIAQVLQAIARHDIKNVVWLTADVHYCAAHHYDPARASFTDFAPFWEFVAGPVNAGTFGPNDLDGTFGPRVDFQKHAGEPNESPRVGNQFFGHVAIDEAGQFTVSLRDAQGAVLYTRTLQPEGGPIVDTGVDAGSTFGRAQDLLGGLAG
ncbi:alkaline phosphatase [Kytococcus schroeteri]|uniref:Alkaline phosphatase n=1 Tax=Kytococcus schroeteri TaxID=138300 RepID=A0A2I1PA46_9MICO|nr:MULTISPECIES: alkaline phosphatase D family protein [Kytococcus]OFS15836.1 alkaline phosphatase [Kytococcus sp. HMSC28H12]PKZ41482.1 alkaline phosphatase [Kytococcus schroeteri]